MTKAQQNVEPSDPPVTNLDPDFPWDQTPIANPFLILKLHQSDRGNRISQPINNHPNFLGRSPYCVDWSKIGENVLTLTISNLGLVASDLIKVNYQFVYCIESTHRIDEGFIHNHFDEVTDRPSGFQLFSFLAPKADLKYSIPISNLSPLIRNLYFRARVSTLWEKPIKPADWNVLTDKAVVESTLQL